MTDAEYISYLEYWIAELETELAAEKKRFNDRVADEFNHTQKMIGETLKAALEMPKSTSNK